MQRILNYLKINIKTRLAKDLGIVFSENLITRGLNFIVIIMLTRLLGPSDYGKYSFVFVSMAFCSAFFDFGMENTAVRFSNKEKNTRDSIFGLYFLVKSAILISITLILILFGKNIFIALNKREIIEYIPYLIIGILGESLLFVNDTYLQAVQKYKTRAAINISRYVISLSFILILYFNNLVLLKYVFYLYFIPLLISLLFVHKYIEFIITCLRNKISTPLLKEVINYEKWMLNLSVGNNILGRIDFLMLSFWVSYSQIGIYNAAFQLSCVVSFLPYIMGKVILPKMSGLSPQEACKFTKKLFKPVLALALIIIYLIPAAVCAVPIILGGEYKDCAVILQVLLLAFTLSFLAVPFEQGLYSLGKPKFIALSKYFQILLIIALNIFTIPKYGMLWAAINLAISRFLLAITLIYLFVQQEKKIHAGEYSCNELNMDYAEINLQE